MWHCNVFIYIAPFDPNTCSRAFSHQSGLNIYHSGKTAHGEKNLYYLINFNRRFLLAEQLYSILYACFPLILVGIPPKEEIFSNLYNENTIKIDYKFKKEEIPFASESSRLTAVFLAWLFCQKNFPPTADHTENQVQSCEVLSTAFPATTAELFHQN